MPGGRSIVINGDLGSGKTTVSAGLAQRLGVRRISIGSLYRQMAHERGMTALQLNLHAELDDDVDRYVDSLQREIAQTGEQLVVDSRLAWVFFGDAFKVHLITDPVVAAMRVLSRPASEVERYGSVQEAMDRLRTRSDSERLRFIARYGADKERLRNYDVVCDTTTATPAELIDCVVACFQESPRPGQGPVLLLDPGRIYPTRDVADAPALEASGVQAGRVGAPGAEPPIPVARSGRCLFVTDGHRRLSAAIRGGRSLVRAALVAEDDEEVADGLSAHDYFAARSTVDIIDAWRDAHGVELVLPPHALVR